MEKITSVKIDDDKWQILKGRGYKLQDIIDNAFNTLLNIEDIEPTELLKAIDHEKDIINNLKRTKETTIKENKKIINKLLESKENKIKEYDKKILNVKKEYDKKLKDLANEKETAINEIDIKIINIAESEDDQIKEIENKINECNFKIKELDKAIIEDKAAAKQEDKYKILESDFKDLYAQFEAAGCNPRNPLFKDLYDKFINKYDVSPENDIIYILDMEHDNQIRGINKTFNVKDLILNTPL